MIDSSLYKELMVTDGGPDEKITSRVWGGGVREGSLRGVCGGCIFEFEDVSGGLRAKEVRDVCI